MRMKNLAVLAALPLAMVACSGGGSGSSGAGGLLTPGASINSQFIDAPVKGLKYKIGTVGGQTGDNGYFPCKAGEEVTFEVKGREIGKASCGEKIFIYDLDGTDAEKDAAAMLIQSLAKTAGGVLDLTFFNESSASVDPVLTLDPDTIQGDLNTFLLAESLNGELSTVSKTDAQAHVALSLPDLSNDEVLSTIAGFGSMPLDLVGHPSNSEDHCWVNVQVTAQLQQVANKTYRFNVTRYIAYDTENVPSSPTCSTQGGEGGDPNGVYECITNPVSKIMTSRSVSGVHYREVPFERDAGDYIACNYGTEYEVSETDTPLDCTTAGGTPVTALADHSMNIGLGYNFHIAASEAGFTVSFVENAVNFIPSKREGNSVNLTTEPITCRYSFAEEWDNEDTKP